MTEQLLLPFQEFEGTADTAAPAADIPHFEQPGNDNEQLLEYQYQYKAGNEQSLDAMYRLGFSVCLKYINKEVRRNRHVAVLSSAEKEAKAHNAITYVIIQYKRHANWFISKSFTAYLFLRIKHELYYRRKVDTIVDFVDLSAIAGL